MPIAVLTHDTKEGRYAMEFRWIAVLTLWTMLIGPMLDTPVGAAKARSQPTRTQKTR